jgi:signal transduction histidine kinase
MMMVKTTDPVPRPHVLVVDDDEIMRSAAHESLTEAGFQVTEAENGVRALQALERFRPDLILLDVLMPEMDGFTTASAIRQLAGCEVVPIMIMTALDDLDSINRAYEAGATDFITKPINWVILVQRVRYMTRYVQMVDAQKQLQAELQQAQKLEAVATLVGGVAHDFNNLLHAILSSAELMKLKHKDNPSGSNELEDIMAAVIRGSKLIRQLLTYSRKIESEKKPLCLNDQVKQVNQLLQRTLPKMIDIECCLDQDLQWVNADEVQIEQVLMNLAINAKDAMPDGGRLRIETANVGRPEEYSPTASTPAPLNWVKLSVADTGQGIIPHTQKHIFEPFFTTKAPGKGTGLGLSMVHGIVRNHGGWIKCQSIPGQGTRFHIYLPAVEAVEEEALPVAAHTALNGHETILLVDDDETILQTGKKGLEKAGYTVLTATNGETAVDIYGQQEKGIDLILLDLMMPGMGGMKCLQALRIIDPGANVIITSGHYSEGQMKHIRKAGVGACLHKPYPNDHLLSTIRQVLARKRPKALAAVRSSIPRSGKPSSDAA